MAWKLFRTMLVALFMVTIGFHLINQIEHKDPKSHKAVPQCIVGTTGNHTNYTYCGWQARFYCRSERALGWPDQATNLRKVCQPYFSS